MHIEISNNEITDLVIFLGLAKNNIEEMELLPKDEYLRTAMFRDIENLLKKFEN